MGNKRITARDTVAMGVAAALAMALSYLEHLLPPLYAALPAVKCGLANIVIVFVLYRMGRLKALVVAVLKVALTALLFGNFVSLAYSAAGAALSLAVMSLLKNSKRLSLIGVSVSGGVAHNVGQILMAVLILGRAEIALYLPPLLISGTLAGILIGACGAVAIKRVG